jgi:hypothetical protein
MKASPWLRVGILASALWLGYIIAWCPWAGASRSTPLKELPGANVAYVIWVVATRSDPFKNMWWDLTAGVTEISLIIGAVAWIFAAFPRLKSPANSQDQPRVGNRAFQIFVIVLLSALAVTVHDSSEWAKATLQQIDDNTSDISNISGELGEQDEKLGRIEDILTDVEGNTQRR